MTIQNHDASLSETTVTYTIDMDGKFILIENVPARISVETGEQYFSPAVVERLQEVVSSKMRPARIIQTPVFEFAT